MEIHYPCKFWFCNCRFSSQHDLDMHLKAMGTDGYAHRSSMTHFWRINGSPRAYEFDEQKKMKIKIKTKRNNQIKLD